MLGTTNTRATARILMALTLTILLASGLARATPVHASGGSGTYDNALIATRALRYVGQWGGNACRDAGKLDDNNTGTTVAGYGGGQCRTFVNCIVFLASGGAQYPVGSDYFTSFTNAGAVEITSIDDLAEGDIVQDGQGTHTFIIVGRVGTTSTFNVVDSNHNGDEMVNSYARTVTLDSSDRAFRMATVVPSSGASTAARPAGISFEGALNLFVRGGDDRLWTEYWSGSSWSGWASLGGGFASDPALIVNGTALNVFIRGGNGVVYAAYNGGGGWSGWAGLNAPVSLIGDPRTVLYGGRLFVFAEGSDGHPYVDVWSASGGWTGFTSLGNYMAGDLVPLVFGSELDIFTRGTDNAIWKDTTWDGQNWSGFSSLGGGLASNPSVLVTGTQMLVWARNSAGELWQDTFTAGAGWSNWVPMGATFTGDPFVMTNTSGDIEVYARAAGDGTVWTRYYSAGGGFWSGWAQLAGAAYLGDPTAVLYGSTELDVLAVGSDGKVYKNTWNGAGWGGFQPQ